MLNRTGLGVLGSIFVVGAVGAIAACSSTSGTSSDPANTDPGSSGALSSGSPGTAGGGTAGGGTAGMGTSGQPLPASCTDGTKNGSESDIDCGGESCAKCDASKVCATGTDCASAHCKDGACVAVGPDNGFKDGTETDVDCGGGAAPACADGKACAAGTDCSSLVCAGGACAAPSSSDNVKNGTESDVDCGGAAAPKCTVMKHCGGNDDCKGGLCGADMTCSPTGTDGVKNNGETDVDCGGGMAMPCADGKVCVAGTDCASATCKTGVCASPTKTDGIKNGTETDVDCGGGAPTNAPKCATNKGCAADGDCDSGVCGPAGSTFANKCLSSRSCTGGPGAGNNCGAGDSESCCHTISVPGGTYKRTQDNSTTTVASFYLDQFEVTQGRFRSFIKAMGGDLKTNFPAWLAAHPGAGTHPKVANSGWRNSFNIRLPSSWNELQARYTLGCADGGNNADGGAATWTDNAAHDATTNDEKSMTCADWYSLYAFCAWDGGFLPTDAQWNYAAGGGDQQREFAWKENGDTTKYSWGADVPVGSDPNNYLQNGFKPGEWIVHAFCIPNYPSCFSVGTPYRVAADGPAHVSAPGKKKDIGRWGHADFGGNMIEYLLDEKYQYGTCTDCANVQWPDPPQGAGEIGKMPNQWRAVGHEFDGAYHPDGGRIMRGGSWERHEYTTGPRVKSIYTEYPVFRSYYAAGARCARPRAN